MTQQIINVGTTPDDGTGDRLRPAFIKTNDNFTELYAGTGAAARTQRLVTILPLVVQPTDEIINCNIAAAVPCTLPLASTRGGNPLTFKDLGHAAANNITLTATAPDLIDGKTSIVLNTNYQSVTLVPFTDGTTIGWALSATGGSGSGGGSAEGVSLFDTLAAFMAATLPVPPPPYVTVRAVTGTYPPPNARDAAALTYRAVSATTGLFGEIIVGGQLYAPVYDTAPVRVGQFGVVGDASYVEVGANNGNNFFTCTSNGSNVLTTASTGGIVVGMNVANQSWHSFAAAAVASAGVIPPGATVTAVSPGVSITLSNPVAAASNFPVMCWSEILTGTDNTVAIQAALDFAMQGFYSDVKFPAGKFLVSDTLNAGWGNPFTELHLIGSRRGAYAGNSIGTVIYSTKTDRPLISIAGARATSLHGLTLVGRNRVFAQYAQWFPELLSSDPHDWMAPNLDPVGSNNPGGIQSTAPYCAIAQDAYAAAAAPTIAYAARTIPSWTAIPANYSSVIQTSSEILIEDCDIGGFGVGIVSGLVNDNQGDFLKIHRYICQSGPYGISVNNSQSRNVEIRNVDYGGFHTFFSATNLGKGDGEVVGPFDNLGGGGSYQTFDIANMGVCGPFLVSSLYFEGQVKVGNFICQQAFGSNVIFNGGIWSFGVAFKQNSLPASVITSGTFGRITLNSIDISGFPRIGVMIGGLGALVINGGNWTGASKTNTSAAMLQAVGYCGGWLLGDVRFSTQVRKLYSTSSLLATNFTAIGGGLASQRYDDEISFQNSNAGFQLRAPMTQFAKAYVDSFGRRWRMTLTPEFTTGPANLNNIQYTNDQMTFGWATANQTSANPMQVISPGMLIFHTATLTLFVVTVVGTVSGGFFPITTIQQNNLVVDATNTFVKNLNTNPSLTGGSIIFIQTAAVIPSTLNYGTFTSGSPNVTAITDGSATSHMLSPANYANGDICYGLPTTISGTVPYRQWPIAPGSTLGTIVDGTPGTLVLSKNALASGVFPIFPYEIY